MEKKTTSRLDQGVFAPRYSEAEDGAGRSRSRSVDALSRFAVLFARSQDPILMVRPEDGRILAANPAAAGVYGYSADELRSLTVRDLHAGAGLKPARDRSGRTGSVRTMKGTHRRKDGSLFPVEVDTQTVELEGRGVEIELVREARMRESAETPASGGLVEELNAILDAIQDPILVYDRGGTVFQANSAAIRVHGFDPRGLHRTVCNRALSFRRPDGSIPNPDEMPTAQALDGRAVIGLLMNITTAGGEPAALEISSFPLVVNFHQVGAVSVWHDVTALKKAEETLHETEQRYQALFNARTNAITHCRVVTDGHGKPLDYVMLKVNPAYEKIAGVKKEDIEGRRATEVFPGIENFEFDYIGEFGRVALEGGELSAETFFEHYRMWISIYAYSPAPGEFTAIFSSIADRKKTEAALRESEQRYAALFNAKTNGISHCRIVCDEAGQPIDFEVLRVNRAFEQVTGIKAGRIEGRRILDVFPKIDPVTFDSILEFGRISQAGGEISREVYFRMAEKWLSIYAFSPKPWEFTVLFTDITARKKAEEALRESEERYRVAVKNAPAVYTQTDRELRFVWTHNFHSDYSAAEILGKVDIELEDSPDTRRLMELKRQVLESGTGLREELTFHRPSGTLVYDMTIEPLRAPDGQIAGVSTAALDITEFKNTQAKLAAYAEKLEESNRDLEQFAFVASHDLQEPLRKIIRFGDCALENIRPEKDEPARAAAAEALNRMQNAALRMQDMIDGLLELSRISTQGRPFESVDLNRIAGEVISDLESRIAQHQARVKVGNLPVLEADPLQMGQLFQNLISNALKFHLPGRRPSVLLTARVAQPRNGEAGQALIRVADNGIGFDEKDAVWIFRPFSRLHAYDEYKGTGMGLAICQKIVERHRGSITVRSRPGKGSTFLIRLPLRQDRGR